MHKLLIPILVALLSACAPASISDPLLTECKSGTYTIHLNFMEKNELAATYTKIGGESKHKRSVMGFVGENPEGEQFVFTPTPKYISDHDSIETLGHEMMHVACGKWHPEVL